MSRFEDAARHQNIQCSTLSFPLFVSSSSPLPLLQVTLIQPRIQSALTCSTSDTFILMAGRNRLPPMPPSLRRATTCSSVKYDNGGCCFSCNSYKAKLFLWSTENSPGSLSVSPFCRHTLLIQRALMGYKALLNLPFQPLSHPVKSCAFEKSSRYFLLMLRWLLSCYNCSNGGFSYVIVAAIIFKPNPKQSKLPVQRFLLTYNSINFLRKLSVWVHMRWALKND